MITDPTALRILCFGDSNTHGICLDDSDAHGTRTQDPSYVRLHPDRRWPGVLQGLLGEGYDVLEEGLNGRTTDIDDGDRPGLNGRSYFLPCLLSHQPLDVVVVQLGGNDLKPTYRRTPEMIAAALGGYVDDVASVRDRRGRVPVTVLVGPTVFNTAAPGFRDIAGDNFDPRLGERSRELAREVRRLAGQRGVPYVEGAEVAGPGDDGAHLTVESHARLAELVGATIRAVAQDG